MFFLKIKRVKKIITDFKPDIVHAHYATSYGLLGAMVGFHPCVLSAWGSDIFDFPNKSFFHRKLIEFNFKKADYICSTSRIMANEIKKYTSKDVHITPFGVDCNRFKPMPELMAKKKVVIGTVKSLEKNYGIEYIIKAFAILVQKYSNLSLELHIGGDGSQRQFLENLVKSLKLKERVRFLGYIDNQNVPKIFNTFYVSVFSSLAESFGVAVLEASACGIPVVVSNVGGLPEVVKNNLTGFMVPTKNAVAISDAVGKLIIDENLRKSMGQSGRNFVIENYEWKKTAYIMEKLYIKIIEKKRHDQTC